MRISLLRTLRSLSPRKVKSPEVVVLTPGIYNSAYFEHAYLAQAMACELVEGSDLVVGKDDCVYMRTIEGLIRVDVIYRRIDDLFLDPEGASARFGARRAGAHAGMARRQRRACKRTGLRRRRRQGHLYIRAGDHPLLHRRGCRSCPTCRRIVASTRNRAILSIENIDKMVVKPANESGGYGMLIGPKSTKAEREKFVRQILANPRNYMAQPMLMSVDRADSGQQPRRAAPSGPAAVHLVRRVDLRDHRRA